jgi:hypothetical protein
MTLQDKYPEGREVFCTKTYNSVCSDGKGDTVVTNIIIFRGEHGVIVPTTVGGCVTIEIMRHRIPCGLMREDVWIPLVSDNWRLVP